MNLPKLLAVGALLTGPALSASLAEKASVGGVYILHSPPQGTCPELDWHVVVGVNGSLAGMISWDDMKSLAQSLGHLENTDQNFSFDRNRGGWCRTDSYRRRDRLARRQARCRRQGSRHHLQGGEPRYAPPPHHD